MANNESSVAGRLGRIEEAVINLKEDRNQSRIDRAEMMSEIKEVRAGVGGLTQTMQSTAHAVTLLSSEKYGERLMEHDRRFDMLESRMPNYALMESEFIFWRRVLGSGFHAVWKLALFGISAGGAGAAIVKWWMH
jgi:hypothetical protein